MLRNSEPGEHQINVQRKEQKKKVNFTPQTTAEVRLWQADQRTRFERALQHAPQNVVQWVQYAQWETEHGGTELAAAILWRCISQNPQDPAPWIEMLLRVKPSADNAQSALSRFPRNRKLTDIALRMIPADNARTFLKEACKIDRARMRQYIDFELWAQSYAQASLLYFTWSNFGAGGVAFWAEWLGFERQFGTTQTILRANMTAINRLFPKDISPTTAEPKRMMLFGYIIQNFHAISRPPKDLEELCYGLFKHPLTPTEQTILMSYCYLHKFYQLYPPQQDLDLLHQYSGTTVQRPATREELSALVEANTTREAVIHLFEARLGVVPRTKEEMENGAWHAWCDIAIDYVSYRPNIDVLRRLVAMVPFIMEKLVIRGATILISNDMCDQAASFLKEAIISSGYTDGTILHYFLREDFAGGKQYYLPYLERHPEFDNWLLALEYESRQEDCDAFRALCTMALKRFKDPKDRKILWHQYTQFEVACGTMDEWENVLASHFDEFRDLPEMWCRLSDYYMSRYGKDAASRVLSAALQFLSGDVLEVIRKLATITRS